MKIYFDIENAIEVLKQYQAWRTYDGKLTDSPKQPEPKEITAAINTAIRMLEGGIHWHTADEQPEARFANASGYVRVITVKWGRIRSEQHQLQYFRSDMAKDSIQWWAY